MMIPGREFCDGAPGHSMVSPKNKRGAFRTRSVLPLTVRILRIVFILVVASILFVVLLVLLNGGISRHDRKSSDAQTETAASSGEGTNMSGAAGKYNANHASVMSPPVQNQLHQEVVRVLQTAQYMEFAALLDNMTESVIRQGITVFAPSDGALSNFQMNKTEGLRVEDVVRLHVITSIMPFSNLLRLEVGSRLTTEASNITIQVTSTSAVAYEMDDAVIVNPDLYTDATIAVHGINALFNTSKIIDEDGANVPVTLPLPSRAFKLTSPIKVKGVAIFHILTFTFAGLFLI